MAQQNTTRKTIKVLQHNERNWKTHKTMLSNTYQAIIPDIILINSRGLRNIDSLKLHGFITYKINTTQELDDGSAILVKESIQHKQIGNFTTDILILQIDVFNGPVNVWTTYLPPTRPYLPFSDIHRAMSYNNPTYLIGDFNAKHTCLGNSSNNNVGKGLEILQGNNKPIHDGPNFTTFISGTGTGTPDVILSDNKVFHNLVIEQGPVTTTYPSYALLQLK